MKQRLHPFFALDTRHDLVVVLRWFGGNAREFFGLLVEAVEAGDDR